MITNFIISLSKSSFLGPIWSLHHNLSLSLSLSQRANPVYYSRISHSFSWERTNLVYHSRINLIQMQFYYNSRINSSLKFCNTLMWVKNPPKDQIFGSQKNTLPPMIWWLFNVQIASVFSFFFFKKQFLLYSSLVGLRILEYLLYTLPN